MSLITRERFSIKRACIFSTISRKVLWRSIRSKSRWARSTEREKTEWYQNSKSNQEHTLDLHLFILSWIIGLPILYLVSCLYIRQDIWKFLIVYLTWLVLKKVTARRDAGRCRLERPHEAETSHVRVLIRQAHTHGLCWSGEDMTWIKYRSDDSVSSCIWRVWMQKPIYANFKVFKVSPSSEIKQYKTFLMIPHLLHTCNKEYFWSYYEKYHTFSYHFLCFSSALIGNISNW